MEHVKHNAGTMPYMCSNAKHLLLCRVTILAQLPDLENYDLDHRQHIRGEVVSHPHLGLHQFKYDLR